MRFMTKQLELDTILEAVSKHAKTDSVKSRIKHLKPAINIKEITNALNEVESLRSLTVQIGQIPLIPDFDIHKLIGYASVNRSYALIEILHIRLFLAMERDIINYYKNAISLNIDTQHIGHYFQALTSHRFLLQNIDDKIDQEGVVKDDASTTLLHLRRKLSKLDKSLQDKLSSVVSTYSKYLSDQVIVIRNNRFCIGVKEGHKNHIKGVVHDVSASGQTVYIEPEMTRQITAEIESLKVDEIKEVERIIAMISNDIQDHHKTLAHNLSQFIELDFIQSKAHVAIEMKGIVPHINNNGMIDLKKAKHPLLDPSDAVPISLQLDQKHKILLITGPNTGGKTVALKTLGLLTMMMQCGMLIPADSHTHLAIFNQIFADIGDEQSISQSLSTFSSHLTKIINMTKEVSDQTLILLDEIGSGTDPNEGVSLAIAILNSFRTYDVRMMVTTHYSELKRYAYEQPDIQTASVAFDKVTLKPLYHIHMGTTGSSHAFLIAQRLGLPQAIIDEANHIYAGRQTDLAKLMAQLNDEMVSVQEERMQLEEIKNRLKKEEQSYHDAKQSLIEKQDDMLRHIKAKELAKWDKKKEELAQILEDIKQKSTLSQPDYAFYKNKLNQSHVEGEQSLDDRELKVGDSVFILPYQQYGQIKAINKDKFEVVFGQFDLHFNRNDLRKDKAKKTKSKTIIQKKRTSSTVLPKNNAVITLDLRGYRYEEVAPALEQAIDRAMLSNLHTLSIIHGFGTGAVRKAVQTYIKQSPYISSSRFGGEGEGLNGVTIITLK